MVTESRHDERDLAEAIRQGSRRRPEQSFGHYYEGHRASCALGAAYEGLYRLPSEAGQIMPKRLERLWDCLEGTIRGCPEGCKKRLMLSAMIIHMNDDHHWTREQIATWVAGNGDTAAKPQDAPPSR